MSIKTDGQQTALTAWQMYLFNPENDLALANFSPYYTPPASAIRMSEELAVLPAWYAGEGARIIAEGELNRLFLEKIQKILPIDVSLIPYSQIESATHPKIIPWGWSPSLRRKLLSLGVSEKLLPSPEELISLRNYSNRKQAVELLHELLAEENDFCGESRFFTGTDELCVYLESIPGDKVMKMPISGSGKGLIWILGAITDKQRDRCRRVIATQGGMVVEPVVTKAKDFAMEFYLQEGKIRFCGYSMFNAAASGAYVGNELLSDSRIEQQLSKYVSTGLIVRLKHLLLEKLPLRFPHYTGYTGVDMMICDTADGYRIHPCVEINMRMNMGMVAHCFHQRYMRPDGEGKLVIGYFKNPESARLFHEKMKRESPLSIEHGKIVSGYLSLTPVTKTSCYTAYAVIDCQPCASAKY